MEEDLRELYQEIILDRNRKPHNFYELEGANRKASGYNPICGDNLIVYLNLENGVIKNISFQGSGCAISKASASLMTESVIGKTVEAAESLFDKIHQLVTTGSVTDFEALGELKALSGIYKFPARVKCSILAWQALRAALKSEDGTITTE